MATAIFLERRLTRVALVAWLGYALPHFVYHTTLVDHFSPFDNLAQLGSLGLQVLLPLVLLALAGTHGAPTRISVTHSGSATSVNKDTER